MQQSLRRFGVTRMDIHLLGRRLVMLLEMQDGVDYRGALKSHSASSQRVAEWERLMKSLQEPSPDAAAWRMVGCDGASLSLEPRYRGC